MAERNLIIYGAGGHGVVVAEAATLAGWTIRGFIDDSVSPGTNPCEDSAVGYVPVLGSNRELGDLDRERAAFIVAVGDNARRDALLRDLMDDGFDLAAITHPDAVVSPSARLGPGAFVGPRAVVHAHALIGIGAIINTGAIVEHHVTIGRCAHVAPGAILCGRAQVGDRALIGAGAILLPREKVGDEAIVGAGSVVIDDVPNASTVVGNPARPTRSV